LGSLSATVGPNVSENDIIRLEGKATWPSSHDGATRMYG
jgi:hypothetical protein